MAEGEGRSKKIARSEIRMGRWRKGARAATPKRMPGRYRTEMARSRKRTLKTLDPDGGKKRERERERERTKGPACERGEIRSKPAEFTRRFFDSFVVVEFAGSPEPFPSGLHALDIGYTDGNCRMMYRYMGHAYRLRIVLLLPPIPPPSFALLYSTII